MRFPADSQQSPHQPLLHDLVTIVRSPAAIVSSQSGDLSGAQAEGYFEFDRKLLSHVVLRVGGSRPSLVGFISTTSSEALFSLVLTDQYFDLMEGPAILIDRHRRLTDQGFVETITLSNRGDATAQLSVELTFGANLASVDAIRSAETSEPLPAAKSQGRQLRWSDDECNVKIELSADPADRQRLGALELVTYELQLEPQSNVSLMIEVSAHVQEQRSRLHPRRPEKLHIFSTLKTDGLPPGLDRLAVRSLDDLTNLLLCDGEHPNDHFVAAGSPWYFTLFGRDSLWTARLLLPHSLTLAEGTLRSLARYQGRRESEVGEEQPGKIPHEVRRESIDVYGFLHLPPVYYGGIDETSLWILLLHESWKCQLDLETVRSLLPELELALHWMRDFGDLDGDGFLEYTASNAGGLLNKAWKDSNTSLRWPDGSQVQGSIATCEVQAYAFAAALAGAKLLDTFGRPGGAEARAWAQRIRQRFRETFWVQDESGRYPAVALDGQKRAVTGANSNIGHLLGTGLLDQNEAHAVVSRLMKPDLECGYGLRCLSETSRGYNPLSYHRGSVWPHDTAICILGLLAEGYSEHARTLAEGLVLAAQAFDYRLPELYGGSDRRRGEAVTAYPSSCTPQAWSAAAGLVAVGVLAGWDFLLAQPSQKSERAQAPAV